MIKTPWRLAGRLLARDWKSGEVLVLLAALVVAVAAMSAVTFFTDRVRSAVSQQAGEALAADLRVESINALPPSMEEAAVRHGLEAEYRVNIEANHATLAGHSFHHEVAYAVANGVFASGSTCVIPSNAANCSCIDP